MVTVHSVVEWCICVSLRCIHMSTCVLHTMCATYIECVLCVYMCATYSVCYIRCVLYL